MVTDHGERTHLSPSGCAPEPDGSPEESPLVKALREIVAIYYNETFGARLGAITAIAEDALAEWDASQEPKLHVERLHAPKSGKPWVCEVCGFQWPCRRAGQDQNAGQEG